MVHPISEIQDNKNKRPIIVAFQNSELQQGEEGKLHTGAFRKSKHKTVVAVATKNILYTGEINRKDNKDELYDRFLLVSNRKTGKVRLIAVDTALVTPKIAPKPREITDGPPDPNSSVSQLNKEFGSKKIKRITEQRERLKMNIDDVKENLEKTVLGVELEESSYGLDNVENESAYRPPIDRSAATVEQVYELHEIVPQFVLESLWPEAGHALDSDLNELDLSPIIRTKFEDLQNSSGDPGMTVNKASLLLYVDYLIKYITKPVKNITKRFILCQSSSEANSHILDSFSVVTNTGRTRPVSMRDKTICYILVLAMIAFDYQLDLDALSKTVKIGLKKLQEMGRILAFSSSGKDKNLMVLRLPLPPPVSVSPKKKKR